MIKPLKDNVLIKRIAGAKETSSGILLKSTLENDKGLVEAIGSDVKELNVGDVVFLNWNAVNPVGDENFIISEKEIIFVYE